MCRALFTEIVLHDNVEKCNRCGRRHFASWMSPDALWNKVQGNRGGQLCQMCFTKLAHRNGVSVIWTPIEQDDEWFAFLNRVAREIDAFQK